MFSSNCMSSNSSQSRRSKKCSTNLSNKTRSTTVRSISTKRGSNQAHCGAPEAAKEEVVLSPTLIITFINMYDNRCKVDEPRAGKRARKRVE